jgi:hypothetical protein
MKLMLLLSGCFCCCCCLCLTQSSLPLAPGAELSIAAADITQRTTLLPEMFSGVTQVISCTAVKVQPKEGDTPDRSKYYQGIKFFDPEIVGDTPETVEYVGLRNVMDVVTEQLGQEAGHVSRGVYLG